MIAISETHDRTGRCLALALTTHGGDGWETFARLLRLRLAPDERVALALAALRACDEADAEELLDGLTSGAGEPQAAFLSPMDQAAFWADMASPDELEAYCLASFKGMARGRQDAFIDYVQGRRAA